MKTTGPRGSMCGAARAAAAAIALAAAVAAGAPPAPGDPPAVVPDPPQVGGEAHGIVQVANLIYAGTMTSKCFSDHFLLKAEKDSTISTSRRFHAVKLSSEEIFGFPLLIMTGEGRFSLTAQERANLTSYLENGGFLLASAGCSSPEWDRSFRAEVASLLPDHALSALTMDHAIFHTVYDIERLDVKSRSATPRPLEGIQLDGRLALVYSQDGLNNTANAKGCCCCGGNEITNSEQVNVNILAYALMY